MGSQNRIWTVLFASMLLAGCSDETASAPTDGAPGAAECGNDTLEAGEACDGTDLGSETCTSQGFDGGALACATGCTFDTTNCTGTGPVCGDALISGPEECDLADLNGNNCTDVGFGGGTLACGADCLYDTTGCTGTAPECGNGAQEGTEECDGAQLAGTACVDIAGFGAGTLGCNANCTFDTGQCGVAACGDGAVNQASEVCDIGDMDGNDCTDFRFAAGGTLHCLADCSDFNTYQCTGAFGICGDGGAEGDEACDDTDLQSHDCASLGYAGGTLACAGDCTFDVAACDTTTAPACGDGTAQPTEQCDTAELRGLSCLDFGFGSGTLACATDCTFDDAACVAIGAPVCGNELLEGAEMCDGAELNGETCADLGLGGGTLACADDCLNYDFTGCDTQPVCGNGTIEANEVCDGTSETQRCTDFGYEGTALVGCTVTCMGLDFRLCTAPNQARCNDERVQGAEQCDTDNYRGESCQSFGFSGGDLACSDECFFDYSGCTP